MIDHKAVSEFYGYTWQGEGERISNCYCKICIEEKREANQQFVAWRKRGGGVQYGVLRSKVLSHIRVEHPQIWNLISKGASTR